MKTVLRKALAIFYVGVAAALCFSGATRAQAPPAAHLGSAVVMVRYEGAWPETVGTKAAAIIVDGPFACPKTLFDPFLSAKVLSHPHAGGECANVRFITRSPADGENGDVLHCVVGACPEAYVLTGMDWRSSVWHDPSGKTLRSWHVWGEAEGEE